MRTLTRRDAVRVSLVVLSGPLLACSPGGGVAEVPLSASPDDAVRRDGSALEIDTSRVPAWAVAGADPIAVVFLQARVIVVRRDATTFAAFSAECPHAGCGVSMVERARLLCPCHGSAFDFEGQRLEGPAPTGLRRLAAAYAPATRRLRISLG